MAEEFVTVTTHTGKNVSVPKHLWEGKRISSMRAYAVETGQATWEEVNPPEAGPPVTAGADDFAEALNIGAGRGLALLGSNLKQFAADVRGGSGIGDVLSDREKAKQAEINRLAKPLKDQFPISSFSGEALPSFAVPGGKGVQLAAGAAEGALQGDTPTERAVGGALGLGLGFAGQKLGDKAGQFLNRQFQKLSGNPKANALDVLARAGIPVSPAQRGRDPIARLTEDLRGIITNSKNPIGGDQVKQLNRFALRSIGEEGTLVSREVLGRAHSRIGKVFDDAADAISNVRVGDVLRDPAAFQRFSDLGDDVADLGIGDTFSGQIKRFYGEVAEAAQGSTPISGERYNQLRSKLGRASRAAWNKGDAVAGETADGIIDVLDDAMVASNPDVAKALGEARAQWKMLRVLRAARNIDPEGNINQRSLMNAFEKVYPGAEVNKFPSGPAGQLGKVLSAFEQVVQPRQTSRTAENLTRLGLVASPLALATANPAAAIIAAGGTGLAAFGGGGSGGLIGGGITRGMLQQLLEKQEEKGQ